MIPLRKVGLIANADKPAALQYAAVAVKYLEGRVHSVLLQAHIAKHLGRPDLAATDDHVSKTDLVLVFGGDGTVLHATHLCAPNKTPMLGINLGRFGFLNEVAPEAMCPALDRLMAGDYQIEERMTLECAVHRPDGTTFGRDIAINEVVIAHGKLARVLHLSVTVNGRYLTKYSADGLIVATPTGSTAYSLSAGGPLVHPSINVMLITPICPHTLTSRALVVPSEHEISVQGHVPRQEGDEMQITVDGQRGLLISVGDRVVIGRAATPALLVTHIGGDTFYEKLQTKLHWGERDPGQ